MTKQTNGLLQSWDFAKSIFINPPYGREVRKWVAKTYESQRSNPEQTIVMLIASRTGTLWFHKYIYHNNSRLVNPEVRFLAGRIKFKGTKDCAPFDSMVVIFRNRGKVKVIDN